TDSWSTGTAGGTARNLHSSVLYNGKIYSWGGISGPLNTVDIYDIAANSWSTGTAGGTARYGHTSVLYNGKIYSWGGTGADYLNTVDIYDIAANSWSTGTAGGTARRYHTSVLYNGKIYSWGGNNGSFLNTVDIYDIAANSWSTGTAGGTARMNHTSVLYNGKMYSWAGNTGSAINTVDIYDIAAASWSTGTAGGSARYNHTSVLYNGKMYSWAGTSGGVKVNTVDIYDIAAASWSTGTAGGTARDNHTSVFYNGKMYSWAGSGASGSINTVDIYDIGFKQTILVLQENGQDTLNFQTGSQLFLSSGMLGIMGGNVGIGTTTPGARLDIQNAGIALNIQNTTDAASNQVAVFGAGNRATPANSDKGYISFNLDDSTGTQTEFSRLSFSVTDVVSSSKDGLLTFSTQVANTLTDTLSITGGNVGIGTTDPNTFKLQVAGNIGADVAPTTVSRTLTTVDSVTSASTGQYTAIYCLSATDCKIAYTDVTNSSIMFADCDDATCSSKTLTTVATGDAGTGYISMYCLSTTDCKIAYYDNTGFDLKMADCDDATCSTKTLTTVDTGTDITGKFSGIYCLATDDCKISYYDQSNLDLRMADCDNATCSSKTLTTVDSVTSASTGQYTAIYCISSTDCKIAYTDDTNFNLMMADCDNSACSSKTLTTVDSATSASTGTFPSIYCVSATDCKIAYNDDTNQNLMMADCDDATCSSKTLTTVDSATSANTGQWNSIYCLSSTDCKIVYRDTTNENLMMADCDNSACSSKTLTTVDSATSARTGEFNSIYCVSSTDCKISYWDGTNTNLMMADCSDTSCSSAALYADGYNLGSSSVFFNSVYAASYFGKSTTISAFDLAENYSVTDSSIEPGDIVSLSSQGNLTVDSTSSPQVEKTSTPYQATLVGVISTKPGITLAEWADATDPSKRPVALVGRVPVKVSDENGPIAIGDPITSSSTPGVGMRACATAVPPPSESDPEAPPDSEEVQVVPTSLCKPGRVVGMALEPYTGSGQGSIMVFINPHWLGNDLSVQDQNGQLVNLDQLREGLAQIGLVVDEDGTLRVQKLVAQEAQIGSLEIGSQEIPSGITVYDEAGNPRCIKAFGNGDLVNMSGKCEAPAGNSADAGNQPPASGTQTSDSSGATDTSTSADTTIDTTTSASSADGSTDTTITADPATSSDATTPTDTSTVPSDTTTTTADTTAPADSGITAEAPPAEQPPSPAE
ncbi:MAG: kelch repeat-containing protein, partial [bacterium]|nr:kelch repeat-containing protein [bacterium]